MNKQDKYIHYVVFTIYFCFAAIGSVTHYYKYYSGIDTAIFIQSYHWASKTGVFMNTLEGIPGQLVNHFAIHSSPIFYMALPVYMIFKHGLVLIIINVVFLALSGLVFYKLVRKSLSQYPALVLLTAYYLLPALVNRYTGQFYEMSFTPFFLLSAIFLFTRYNFLYFLAFLTGTMFIKEHLFLVGFVFSFLSIIEKRKLHWSLIPACLALFWFIMEFKFIMPVAQNGNPLKLLTYEYGKSANSFFSLIYFFTTNLDFLLDKFRNAITLHYLYQVFIPVMFILPVLSRWFILASAFMVVKILFIRWSQNIIGHYSLDSLPVLYFAASEGIKKISRLSILKIFDPKKIQLFICVIVLLLVLSQSPLWLKEILPYSKSRAQTMRRIQGIIPPTASMATTRDLLSYFAERDKISLVTMKTSPFVFPFGTDYVLFDEHPIIMFPSSKQALDYIKSASNPIPGYKLIFSQNGFFLFKKISFHHDFYELISGIDQKSFVNTYSDKDKKTTYPLIIESNGDIFYETNISNRNRVLVSQGNGTAAQPAFAVSRNIIHVLWVDTSRQQGDIYYREINLLNPLRGRIIRVTATQEHSHSPCIAVDRLGGIHMSWVENESSPTVFYKFMNKTWGIWSIQEKVFQGTNPQFINDDKHMYMLIRNLQGKQKLVRLKGYWN